MFSGSDFEDCLLGCEPYDLVVKVPKEFSTSIVLFYPESLGR
jgi:hypothetical protein